MWWDGSERSEIEKIGVFWPSSSAVAANGGQAFSSSLASLRFAALPAVSSGAVVLYVGRMTCGGSGAGYSAKGLCRGSRASSLSVGAFKHTFSTYGGAGVGAGAGGFSGCCPRGGSARSAGYAAGMAAAGGGRLRRRERPKRDLRVSACVLRKSVVGVSNLLRRILSLPCSVSIWRHMATTGELTRTNLLASEAGLAGERARVYSAVSLSFWPNIFVAIF